MARNGNLRRVRELVYLRDGSRPILGNDGDDDFGILSDAHNGTFLSATILCGNASYVFFEEAISLTNDIRGGDLFLDGERVPREDQQEAISLYSVAGLS